MALGSMPSRIRDLQLEAAAEQDFERRNRQRAEAEAMLAEEEASVGPRPGPMVAPPKGVPVERGGAEPAPLGDARLSSHPKLGAAARGAIVAQGAVGPALQRGLQAVGDFAGSVGSAAAGAMKPDRMQEMAKPVADGMEQLGRTMGSAEGKAVADKVEDSNDRRDRRKQMGKISDEERAAAEAQFNKLWEADDGAIRTTYTTEDGRPDFQSFLNDMVEPGEDPRTALGRVMQNIAGRDGGTDAAGRKLAGYTTPVTPVAPPSADEAEKQSRAVKPFVPGASRLPPGVTRPNAFSAKPSGGENGQGQNRIRVGMAAHTNAHELAGDQRHDMEPDNGGFPTTMDKWAEMFRQNNNPDDERAYVLMFAQQNGFDFTGVPEEDQYDAAQRMTAETLFRYGDAEQKKWAKGWGNLKGDRWHISMKRDDKGNRSPIATQPMRTAAWDPTTGTFVESATEFARGQTQRLRDISDTREAVKRSPTNFMDEGDFIQQMGEDNWNSLTPAQQTKFLGEAARGMEVHRFNVARGQAQRRGLTGNAATIGAQYSMEMDAATTPLQKLAVSHKHGDQQGIELWSRVVAGEQGVDAAAAGARPGELTPAQNITDAAAATDSVVGQALSSGDIPSAMAAAGDDGTDAGRGRASQTVAAKSVQQWKGSESPTAQGLVLSQGMQPYLRNLANAEFQHAFLPGSIGGESDYGPGRGNATMARAFAERVISDHGLQGVDGIEQALIDWWRGHHGFKDSYVPGSSAPPSAKPPTSTGMGTVAPPGAPPTRGGSIGF
jgi:hypothetical protein